jgi:hypothetical protein
VAARNVRSWRNAQNYPKTCCPLGAVENRRHPCLPRSDDVRRNRNPHDVRFSVCRSIRMGIRGVGACFRRPRHGRGFLADCVDRSSRLGCCATANPGKAIVEQASSTRTLLDPRAFQLAIQAGRALGWQRLVPLLLIGILGVQWARETHKDAGRSDGA